MQVPLNTDVYCIDGLVGRSITTISDPTTKKITHILVVETHNPYVKRLVPIVLVKEIDDQVIRLNCTGKQFEKIERLEKIVAHPTGGYISHLVLERDQAWS